MPHSEAVVNVVCGGRVSFRAEDPIFSLATPLQPEDADSHTRETLAPCALPDDGPGCPGGPGDGGGAPAVQGGWFGRGYNKGKKRKKVPS